MPAGRTLPGAGCRKKASPRLVKPQHGPNTAKEFLKERAWGPGQLLPDQSSRHTSGRDSTRTTRHTRSPEWARLETLPVEILTTIVRLAVEGSRGGLRILPLVSRMLLSKLQDISLPVGRLHCTPRERGLPLLFPRNAAPEDTVSRTADLFVRAIASCDDGRRSPSQTDQRCG